MSVFQIVMVILALVPIVGTVLYHIFVVGRIFNSIEASMQALSSSITNLDHTFSTTVQNLENTFNLKLDNLSENFKDMKNTQEKFADIVNDIVIKQMRNMDKDITVAAESIKSFHHRLDCIERRNQP